ISEYKTVNTPQKLMRGRMFNYPRYPPLSQAPVMRSAFYFHFRILCFHLSIRHCQNLKISLRLKDKDRFWLFYKVPEYRQKQNDNIRCPRVVKKSMLLENQNHLTNLLFLSQLEFHILSVQVPVKSFSIVSGQIRQSHLLNCQRFFSLLV